MHELGIIGGGHGGLAVLTLISKMDDFRVKWLADLDENAVGMQKARELGVATIQDFLPELKDERLDMVIEVTGNEKVQGLIASHKKSDLIVLESLAANILITVVSSQERLVQTLQEEASSLATSTENLISSINQITVAMEQLTAGTSEIARLSHNLENTTGKAQEAVRNTNEILKFIEKISRQTKIIGLNASIEAARVGDAGKGFAVVADEVKKLADNSSVSVEKITKNISSITAFMATINKEIQHTSTSAKEHAAASGEISTAIGNIEKISMSLEELVKKMLTLA